MRPLLLVLLFFAAGVATWLAWLSWGFVDNAYPAWQVVACGATAVALTALGAWRTPGLRGIPLVAVPLALGLTTAWTVWAANGDDTGLYAVGAVLMAVGTVVGLTLVAAVVGLIRRRAEAR